MSSIRISTACTEFGRTFTVGQIVNDLSELQASALAASALARFLNGATVTLPAPGDIIPITSVQFASPAAYGLNVADDRVYSFNGGRYFWSSTGWMSVALPTAVALAVQAQTKVIAPDSDIIEKFALTHHLYGSKGSVVSFSRNASGINGLSTVTDFEGYIHEIRTDEPPFELARRVENLIADVNLVTGWTTEASTTPSVSANGQGKKYLRTAANLGMHTLNSVTYKPGMYALPFSAWVESGTVTLHVRIERADTTLVAEVDIPLTTTVRRFSFSGLIPDRAQGTRIIFGIASGSNVHFCIGSVQLQRNANGSIHPSEYVPRGVAGAVYPFQGCGVDGVQYFNTLNPCFQEANYQVKDDNTPGGVPLPIRPWGIKGSPKGVQRFLQCCNFADAVWTKTGFGTPVAAPLVDNPLGYGMMQWLPETETTSVHTVSQTWSGTAPSDNSNLAVSYYAKPADGRRWLRVGIVNKAGETIQFWYDLVLQKVGKISTSGTTTITEKEITVRACINGIYRVGMGGVSAGSGGTAVSGFAGLTDSDGNTAAYLGVVGNGIWLGGALLEAADHPTSLPGISIASVIQRNAFSNINPPWPAGLVNDFTVIYDATPAWNRGSPRMKAFYYLGYWSFDGSNRGGCEMRTGVFGANTGLDRNAGAFAQDFYNESSIIFGGTNITLAPPMKAWTTFKQAFGISSAAQQPNYDGSFMAVDGVLAYPTSSATPTLAPIVNPPTSIQLGKDGNNQDHECCFRDLVFINRVLTPTELAKAGSYA
jgi:hypothetical protein